MSQFIEMFKGDYQTEKWEDCLSITNGKKYDGDYQEYGSFPICGSGGIMGYGESKFCDKDTVILGRKGNINSPIYMKNDYWIVDTAFSLAVDRQKLQPKYFYFWCKRFDFTKYNKQGVLPSLTKNDLQKIEIPIPPMELQTSFVVMLEQADKSEFDGFKSQFIEMFGFNDEYPKGTEILSMEEVVSKLFAGGDKPTDYSDSANETYKYPIIANGVGETGVIGYSKESRVDEDALTISARGTIGYCAIRKAGFLPVVRLITLVPNHKVLLLYLKFYFEHVGFESTGAVQGQLTMPSLKEKIIVVPPLKIQKQFCSLAEQADKSENRSELKQAS